MCVLYRVEDETCIEMSREAWEFVSHAVAEHLSRYPQAHKQHLAIEIGNFSNAVRSHLQHGVEVAHNNADLI